MPERSADVLARRIAAFGLPGAAQKGPVVVSDHDWRHFVECLYSERITGLAVAAVAGVLKLSEEQSVDLMTGHKAAMAWALMVERTVLSVAEDLDAAGIPFVLLKGASLARTMYPDPEWRAFGDLDLLVRPRTGGVRVRCSSVADWSASYRSRAADSTSASARRPCSRAPTGSRSTCTRGSSWVRSACGWIWTSSSSTPLRS